jgi:hypothetical protein
LQTQYRDLKRSLIPGLGNFRLIDQLRKYSVTGAAWEQKSKPQQHAYFQKFLKAPVMSRPHATYSTDEQLAVLTAPDGGKKKNQLKRKRNARTTIRKQPKINAESPD